MARPEPPQAVLNSLQLLQEPRAVLNLVQAVLNSLQHLQEPRAVLNSLLSLGAQVNDLWTASVLHSLAGLRAHSGARDVPVAPSFGGRAILNQDGTGGA